MSRDPRENRNALHDKNQERIDLVGTMKNLADEATLGDEAFASEVVEAATLLDVHELGVFFDQHNHKDRLAALVDGVFVAELAHADDATIIKCVRADEILAIEREIGRALRADQLDDREYVTKELLIQCDHEFGNLGPGRFPRMTTAMTTSSTHVTEKVMPGAKAKSVITAVSHQRNEIAARQDELDRIKEAEATLARRKGQALAYLFGAALGTVGLVCLYQLKITAIAMRTFLPGGR